MIHTKTPSTSKRTNFNFYPTYLGASKVISEATSYQLKEVSKYGAEIWLGFGRDENGALLESLQLTKKKIRWSDIVLELFGVDPISDQKQNKQIADELMKHGLIIIRD